MHLSVVRRTGLRPQRDVRLVGGMDFMQSVFRYVDDDFLLGRARDAHHGLPRRHDLTGLSFDRGHHTGTIRMHLAVGSLFLGHAKLCFCLLEPACATSKALRRRSYSAWLLNFFSCSAL